MPNRHVDQTLFWCRHCMNMSKTTISFFDMLLTILKMKVAWTLLFDIFFFRCTFTDNFFFHKIPWTWIYGKTQTTNGRNKFSNLRVFLNFSVIYSEKKIWTSATVNLNKMYVLQLLSYSNRWINLMTEPTEKNFQTSNTLGDDTNFMNT